MFATCNTFDICTYIRFVYIKVLQDHRATGLGATREPTIAFSPAL